MASQRGGSSQNQAAPWARLRAWIDEKERYERMYDEPAFLTPGEANAIAVLVPDEEVVGDNFVSRLNEWAQSKHHALPTFRDEPVQGNFNGNSQLRWRCYCTLDWCRETFPRQGYGFSAGEEAPAFKVKKSAKQFAAKQAFDFVTNRAPAAGSSTSSSPSIPRAEVDANNGARLFGGEQQQPPPQLFPASAVLSAAPSEPVSLRDRVANLAGKLGFDHPEYHVRPQSDDPGRFCGQPYFRMNARMPDNLGVVSNVESIELAKDEIAMHLLLWLQGEERARKRITQKVLDDFN